MDKIMWCARQLKGLRLVEPNSNLAGSYIGKAEEALESVGVNVVRDWKISTAYYTIYFSLYALLMKIGVKCEIHSCTIAFAKAFLAEYFNGDELDFVEDSLRARIDTQYYVDRTVPDPQYAKMLKFAPVFLVKCKSVLPRLNEKKIGKIRNNFQNIIRRSSR